MLPTEGARDSDIGATVGPSELASSSLMTALERQGPISGLSLLLRRGDSEVPLGHGNFLQELEEFKAFPSRDQRITLENEIFQVSSNCILSSGNHVAHP